MSLQEWMDANNITARDIAGSLGVTTQAVYGWISGTFVPSTPRLIQLHMTYLINYRDFVWTSFLANSFPLRV